MYEYIQGKLTYSCQTYAVIDAHGVGYKILIPLSQFGGLPEIGQMVLLYTSWVVRDVSQTLYGFKQKEERDLFELLITLSGIGPKTALGIVGHLPIEELKFAVRTQNILTLSKIPGIGKKTAERLIVDLKEKLDQFQSSENQNSFSNKLQDALNALTQLGYSSRVAEKAVQKAQESLSQECELPELITAALRFSKSS